MAETNAGKTSEELSELGIASSTDKAGDLDAEAVLEDELEIVDAGPEERQDSLKRQDGAELDIPPRRYGTRGEAPGPRGCWAIAAPLSRCLWPQRYQGASRLD
jgi:hypothetical protein